MNFIFDEPTEHERMEEVARRRIERGDTNPYGRIMNPLEDGYYDVPNRPPQWLNNLINTVRELYNNQRPSRYTPHMEGLNNQEEEMLDLPAPPVPPFSHIVPQQAPPVRPLQRMLPPPPNNNNKQMPEPIKATEGDLACIICMENIADHCIIPCGHISLCVVCSNRLKQESFPKCPTCRGSITDIIQTFSVAAPYHAGGRKTKRSKKSRKIKKSRKSHK
jgi:hypothetical protein